MRQLLASLALVSCFVSGCGDTSRTTPAASASAAASPIARASVSAAPASAAFAAPAGGHAGAGAVPGSHEDWCGEHQVPESQCTRCDASLVPAFRLTRDWCIEHSLPESQCLKCNPNLKIVRPPKGAGR